MTTPERDCHRKQLKKFGTIILTEEHEPLWKMGTYDNPSEGDERKSCQDQLTQADIDFEISRETTQMTVPAYRPWCCGPR